MAEITFLPIPDDDRIKYCIDVILKEAKLEDVAVKQLFYSMLSMYTKYPRNVQVSGPSGEGKNYIIRKVADLFPKEDVIKFVGMSDKSLFHRTGRLVMKDDTGEYVDIEKMLEKNDEDIDKKREESAMSSDKNLKAALKAQIKELEKEKGELYKQAKKLIDLSHKTIIFLDTPPQGLLNAIMSLLSHDEYEVEYDYVDTNNGIKTHSNVLRGWPVFIFAQALDTSDHKRYAEIQRRFIITNPRMDQEKYKAAIELIGRKYSLPDFMYQKLVVSDEQKDQAREIIKGLKDKILDLTGSVDPGRNNVCIPFERAIIEAASKKRASDMTTTERIFGYLTLLAQVNVDKRPVILFRKIGHPITEKIPLATFDDLKEALFLMQYSNGVRPYIVEWFNDVLLFTHNGKSGPDSRIKWVGSKEQTIYETRIGVTSQELADATMRIKGKKLSAKQIRESHLFTLINEGYVDSVPSELDKRADIYFPVIEDKIGDTAVLTQSLTFDPQIDIRGSILALMDIDSEKAVLNSENIDQLMEYYKDPENYFGKKKPETDSPGDKQEKKEKNIFSEGDPKSISNGGQIDAGSTKEAQKYEIGQKPLNLLSSERPAVDNDKDKAELKPESNDRPESESDSASVSISDDKSPGYPSDKPPPRPPTV